MTSGNTDSLTAKEKLENFNQILSQYLEKKGLIQVEFNKEAISVLTLKSFQLKSLTSEECGEYAFTLSQYALYVQQKYNEEMSTTNWASSSIKKIVASHNQFDRYIKYEEKEQTVIASDEHASKLNDILLYSRAAADHLAFLSTRVQNISNTLLELQRTKRKVPNVG